MARSASRNRSRSRDGSLAKAKKDKREASRSRRHDSRSISKKDRRDDRRRSRSRRRRSPSRRRGDSRSRRGRGGVQVGYVTAWRHDKGFGFIRPDHDGNDIFVHVRELQDGNALREGDEVKYEEGYDARARKPQAERVTGAIRERSYGRGRRGRSRDRSRGRSRDRSRDRSRGRY